MEEFGAWEKLLLSISGASGTSYNIWERNSPVSMNIVYTDVLSSRNSAVGIYLQKRPPLDISRNTTELLKHGGRDMVHVFI